MMGFEKDKMAFGPKNFKYLDDLIHSGAKEIVLDSDIVLSEAEQSQYLEGIRLDADDLTIDGNGHTIDAQGKARIFHCTGKNITIINIVLENGYAEENGGAIYNSEGELTITESTLTKNMAIIDGGAICNGEGSLTITESTLIGNRARFGSGGAIKNCNGEIIISKSTLTGNTAEWDGGAIENSWTGKLTIMESSFQENIADENGMIASREEFQIDIAFSVDGFDFFS